MLAGLALSLLCLLPAVATRRGPYPILQPATYRSPDAHWSLDVDPSQRHGGGLGSYSMHKDGRLVWSGERPWSLWQAVVTDAGFVAGYAYTGGIDRAEGFFELVLIAPDGDARLDDKVPRRRGRGSEAGPTPNGTGIVHLQAAERVIFRVDDNAESGELWIGYQLPGCNEVFRKRPRDQLAKGSASIYRPVTRSLRDAPLFVAQWERYEFSPYHDGAHFALFDADASLVWQLVRPDDWGVEDKKDSSPLWDRMRSAEGLLEPTEPMHFDLWAPASHVRLDFEVRTALGKSGWEVIDKGSTPMADPPLPAPSGVSLEEVQLEERGVAQLESGRSALASPVHDIAAFAFENAQVIRVVRQESRSDRFTLLRVDPSSRVLSEHKVEIEDSIADIPIKWWSTTDHSWIVTQSPYGHGDKSRAWSVDDATGTASALPDFDFPSVKDLDGLGSGRFVVLGTEDTEYQSLPRIAAFDARGKRLWEYQKAYSNDSADSFLSPQSVAVTGDGRIAVLDNIRKSLQYFDGEGSFVRFVDLKTAFGQEPHYPLAAVKDVKNGVLIHDFDGKPPMWNLNADDTVGRKWTPTLRDGRDMYELQLFARVAPDGEIWTTDRTRMLRLDAAGVVDLAIGSPLEPDELTQPSTTAVDVFGRVLVRDRSTCAVHVFDRNGKRLFVARPRPQDIGHTYVIDDMGATRDGGAIVFNGKETFLLFDPHGAPLGVRGTVPTDFAINPSTGFGAGTLYDDGWNLYDEQWALVKHVERRPDRRWLQWLSPPGMGADGTIAFYEPGESALNVPSRSLLLYDAKGEKGRIIDLPSGTLGHSIALSHVKALLYSWRNDCAIVDLSSGRTNHFRVPGSKENSAWTWGFSADGSEILALDVKPLLLHRYAAPR
jgi:hypothetical protein